MRKFDVMVIGTGSGLEISSEAAADGLSVAVVEEGPFGGPVSTAVASRPRC